MRDQVAIVGVGQTTYESQKQGQVLDEIVFEAASKALAEAGLTRDEVDCVTIAAADQIDGRPISSMLEACPAGAYLKDEIKKLQEQISEKEEKISVSSAILEETIKVKALLENSELDNNQEIPASDSSSTKDVVDEEIEMTSKLTAEA